ncbi:hypothetical protein QWY84_04325 [Aquisalimonas lutea]|uniref:DUF4340 domain-containing protein n=1 Tax=Aquisalimonas lutea TaxID=1327750 RepID=UPI0025B3691E|nr:DUF4340 domain-containing protein [Aquisalimonas lutea]MDN3516833.1 hypothetical protein [Aquisalimonas lutea]
MRRRLLINLVMVLIAAALAAFAWLDARRDGGPSRLTALDADAVDVIRLQRHDRDDVRMERRPQGWWLTEPVEARASDFHVRQVLALADLRSRAQYTTREVDPDEAGLTPPRAHVTLDGTGIRLGAQDPVDDGLRYAMVGERVHLVRNRVMPLVSGPWWNFLDRHVLGEGREAAALVTEALEVRREEAGWRVVRGDLDPAAAGALMAAWQELEALVVRPLETAPDGGQGARVIFADGGERRFIAGQADGEVRLVDVEAQRAYVLNEDVRRYLLTGRETD